MSGLAGIFDFSGAFRENSSLWISCARRMQARLSHRGHGILREQITEHGILLQGDPTDAGGQICREPVFCYANCAVLLDGHLTEKEKLCRTLRRKGVPCSPRDPDCMLIVLSYFCFGTGLLRHLQGGFSFVLYDALKRKVFLCRDALGVKPMFFAIAQNRLIFASEIKGLLEHPDVFPAVNAEGLCTLLLRAPYTAGHPVFCGIRELPPGTCGSFDRNGYSEERFLTETAACTHHFRKKMGSCPFVANISSDLQAEWMPAILARDLPGTALEDAALKRRLSSGASAAESIFRRLPDKGMFFTPEYLQKTLRPEIAERIWPHIHNHTETEPTVFAERTLFLERLDRCLAQGGQAAPQLVHTDSRTRTATQKPLHEAVREKLRVILSDRAQPIHFLFSADALRQSAGSKTNLRPEAYLIQLNFWMNHYGVRIRF